MVVRSAPLRSERNGRMISRYSSAPAHVPHPQCVIAELAQTFEPQLPNPSMASCERRAVTSREKGHRRAVNS